MDASLPCNWGLTEEATRSSTCAGAKTLAAIEKQEVDRRNLQVSVVGVGVGVRVSVRGPT